jgi:hypothetical protein
LLLFGLLLAIHHVMRGAVQQGELRRELTAFHSAAASRCHTLRGRLIRDDCMQKPNAAPLDEAAPHAQNVTTIAAPEPLGRQPAVFGQ